MSLFHFHEFRGILSMHVIFHYFILLLASNRSTKYFRKTRKMKLIKIHNFQNKIRTKFWNIKKSVHSVMLFFFLSRRLGHGSINFVFPYSSPKIELKKTATAYISYLPIEQCLRMSDKAQIDVCISSYLLRN